MKQQLTLSNFIAKKTTKQAINNVSSFNGFTVINTAADNSCMFAAIAHQLSLGTETAATPAQKIRLELVSYVRDHPSTVSNFARFVIVIRPIIFPICITLLNYIYMFFHGKIIWYRKLLI